ncbi:MAG: NAD(P)/FAD-dependent oxidoreductase [Nocardioides sp.]|uniref:NAD(P)/FAD-dependent oxidoreductase n=1 Tax=Nocardioides sp. TaxID=35761 RepID=UPI0039E26E30
MGERVAVIGAGPMGLATAYQLTKDGHTPVLYEAAPKVGGMCITFDFDGTDIERFYHFHATSDVDFFELADELGLGDRMRWKATKMGLFHNGRLQPWGNPVALLKFKGLSLIGKIRYGLHAFTSVKRNTWDKLDKLDAKQWVLRWIGRRAYDVTWKMLFDLKFYDYADNLSAAWIWSRIRRIGRSRSSLMAEKLGAMEGGSTTWLDALSAAIVAGGGEIRTSTPVTRVVLEGEGTGQRVTGVETEASGFEGYDRVISTVPLPYVPRILPDLPAPILEQYQAKKNIAVVCVITKLRRPLTENFWTNVNDPEIPFIPGVIEYSHVRDLANPGEHIVYVPFYVPGEHPLYAEPDERFEERVRDAFKRISPDLVDDDITGIVVSRYRYAQPICEPGFLDTLPDWNLPVDGLYVADTSYYYPEDRGISESIKFGRMMARTAAGELAAR